MSDFGNEDLLMVESLIKKMVRKEVSEMYNRVLIPGTVSAVTSGTYSIIIDGNDTAVTGIKSPDGVTLIVDDRVILGKINGSTTNLIVLLKYT